MISNNRKKVYVGMSGGVDSSTTAYLLKKNGYDVTGVFMKNWSPESLDIQNDCPWENDMTDAQKVCEYLEIPFRVYNFESDYRNLVIEPFFKSYAAGHTPNPDILCNRYIKFDLFLKRALGEGADYIATGHYAGTDGVYIYKGVDEKKDQSYFLSTIQPQQLRNIIFPLWKLKKKAVREIAQEAGIPTYAKKDSQGICFVGKIDVRAFIKSELGTKIGDIVDLESDKIVGSHEGYWFYTVGQRRGLQVGGVKLPYYVYSTDPVSNTVYVVQGRDNPKLYNNKISIKEVLQYKDITKESVEDFSVVIRYRGLEYKIKNIMSFNSGIIVVELESGAFAPSMGQTVVIYKRDMILASGTIGTIG